MSETSDPRWRGINHLALITNDMDATVRFYHGVLGARLVTHLGNEHLRHYFFEIGPGQTVAFFEYRNHKVKAFAKPAGIPDPRAIQFDHLSLNLADEYALEELQARLKAHGCEVTDVVDHEFVRSIYFTDNNGIALEASWWVTDATGREADYGDEQLFSDSEPVPAVAEIAAGGLASTGTATALVQEPTDIPDPA
jgi:catechol 2,3-dioxygenase-like lactoylglutathione lyase family enzyme